MGWRRFLRQFNALFVKNRIVISRHPFASFIRFFVFPLAYGIFLSYGQDLFDVRNNYGLGSAVPIQKIRDTFDGSSQLLWVDNTDGNGLISASTIMEAVTANFTDVQKSAVHKVGSVGDINNRCVASFNGDTSCFLAISFDNIPRLLDFSNTTTLNYTIYTAGPTHIDVEAHDSTDETHFIPVQWAIDQAIINLTTGANIPTPHEQPFTWHTNTDRHTALRISFIKLMNTFLTLPFLLAYTGITYQLAGAISLERASQLTSHMKAMGLSDAARLLSWHTSSSLLYLPAWMINAAVWKARIFIKTDWRLIVFLHILTGLYLASWSLFVCQPFGKNPQMASVFTSGLAIAAGAIPIMLSWQTNVLACILSFFSPSMFYIFAIKAICGYELKLLATNATKGDPNTNLQLLPLMIAAMVGVVVWPILAYFLENILYDMPDNSKPVAGLQGSSLPDNIAISIRNLEKTFSISKFPFKKERITAVADLSLEIPKKGIFVLLGPNGSGKSTIISILGGLSDYTNGSIIIEGDVTRPRGSIGIVPQKDVLFPELTCLQNLIVWSAIKSPERKDFFEHIEGLLQKCDLQAKIHANAGTLSGGQKRKLQLAAGLVGGSEIILVDECTSGVDPLSRRALWKTLTSFRSERTIVLTTHFLDEADFLADDIAIIAAPGKLLAQGSPVALKSRFGSGYSVKVTFDSEEVASTQCYSFLNEIFAIVPEAEIRNFDTISSTYGLNTKDVAVVALVVRLIENRKLQCKIVSYDVLGASVEDVFLQLTSESHRNEQYHESDSQVNLLKTYNKSNVSMELHNGRARSPLSQAFTIFHKRTIIVRRSWLAPLLAILLGIFGSWWPIRFIGGQPRACGPQTFNLTAPMPLYPPPLLLRNSVILAPVNVSEVLGPGISDYIHELGDNETFVSVIKPAFLRYTTGGVSIDNQTGDSLIPWVAENKTGLAMFNMASNLFLNHAFANLNLDETGSDPKIIITHYQKFPKVQAEELLSLRWVVMFGAVMAAFPAVCALYVSNERYSSVQAMQLSNGLADPIGLWLGHLMFDTIQTLIVSLAAPAIFSIFNDQIKDVAIVGIVIFLYGIAGSLLAYIATIFIESPLAALLLATGYQFVILLLYLTSYILTLKYSLPSDFSRVTTIVHFTLSVTAPITSLTRSFLISINQFTLLCDGDQFSNVTHALSLSRHGGPILYLLLWIFGLLALLSQVDSGSIRIKRFLPSQIRKRISKERCAYDAVELVDVATEAGLASHSADILHVKNISKLYRGKKVIDDVSFSVANNSKFALLGPNGAGKTTMFNIIRGKIKPSYGDVLVNEKSVVRNTKSTRLFLGVCPQFTAIDSQLTVHEHLMIYGRLKGLDPRTELKHDIDALLSATGLNIYADRLAGKLSGGNGRKLCLAIALIGNPSVLLVDEFSTGIDAKMKRELWEVLQNVCTEKAVLLTTHSMEEASALSTKVGIMSKRMLAVGTPRELEARYGTYEVQFTVRTWQEFQKIQMLMSRIPGSHMVDDVATRFEVPITNQGGSSLADLFGLLAVQDNFPEFVVSKSTLESAFIKVVRENNVTEEDLGARHGLCC